LWGQQAVAEEGKLEAEAAPLRGAASRAQVAGVVPPLGQEIAVGPVIEREMEAVGRQRETESTRASALFW
jgi:hypothetical protein